MDTLLAGNIAAFICVYAMATVTGSFLSKRVLKDKYNMFLTQKDVVKKTQKGWVKFIINTIPLIWLDRFIFNLIIGAVYLTGSYENPFLYIQLANLTWLAYVLFSVCVDYVISDD